MLIKSAPDALYLGVGWLTAWIGIINETLDQYWNCDIPEIQQVNFKYALCHFERANVVDESDYLAWVLRDVMQKKLILMGFGLTSV